MPLPTTRPGAAAGGAPPTAAPGTTRTPTGPPPPPSCAITDVTVTPNEVTLRSNERQISDDVVVRFRPVSCGSGGYRVRVKDLDLAAEDEGGGWFEATINKTESGWTVGNHTITISGPGGSATANLNVR